MYTEKLPGMNQMAGMSGLDPALLSMGGEPGMDMGVGGGNSLPDMGGDPSMGQEVNMGGPVPPPPPIAPELGQGGGDPTMDPMGGGMGMNLDPNMMGGEMGGGSPMDTMDPGMDAGGGDPGMDMGPMPPPALPPNPPNQGFETASIGGSPGGDYQGAQQAGPGPMGSPAPGGMGMGQGGRMAPLTDSDLMKMKGMFGGGSGL